MYSDTLLTTNEEDRLLNKVSRLCLAGVEKPMVKHSMDTERRAPSKLDFGLYIKESPFSKFSKPTSKLNKSSPKSDSDSQDFKMMLENNIGTRDTTQFSSEQVLHGNAKPTQPLNSGLQTRKLPISKKSCRTYPRGILKKGENSKYSKNFQQYFRTDYLSQNNYDIEEEEDPGLVNDSELELDKYVPNNPNGGEAETQYTCGDDEEVIAYKDRSIFNSQNSTVRVFPGAQINFERMFHK